MNQKPIIAIMLKKIKKYINFKARTNVKISQFDDKGAHCSNKTVEH